MFRNGNMEIVGGRGKVRGYGGRGKRDVERDGGWRVRLVAPSFSDFDGRSWEARYPDVLAAYYVASCAQSGSGRWDSAGVSGFSGSGEGRDRQVRHDGGCAGAYFEGIGSIGGRLWSSFFCGEGSCCSNGNLKEFDDDVLRSDGKTSSELGAEGKTTEELSGVVCGRAAESTSVDVEASGGSDSLNEVKCGKQSKKNARKRARAKELKRSVVSVADVVEGIDEVEIDCANVGRERDGVKTVVGSQVVGDECVVNGVSGLKVSQTKVDVGDVSGTARGVSYRDVTTVEEQKEFARQWYERKCVENSLAIQRAKYNVKRNEYLDRSRISEQRWETERLNCDEKLARISAARLGCVVGSAQTVVSEEEKSLRPPSLSTGSDSPAELSDGTVSPDSSISVAEGVRLSNKVKKVEGDYAEIKLKYDMLLKAVSMGGSKIVIDGKDIHEYDGTGQYVPPFDEEVESLYDGRGHLLDAWEAGMDY